MNRVILSIVVGAAMFAAESAYAACGFPPPGTAKDGYITYYQTVEQTGSPVPGDGYIKNLGGAISGGYYGNTSNAGKSPYAPSRGHGVTPSASPGPFVGGVNAVPGASLGYFITCKGPDAVPNLP